MAANAISAERVSYHPQRVTSRRPCVMCGRLKYCGFDPLAGVAFCPHTPSESGRQYGNWGYIHQVGATPTEYNEYAARTARPEPIISAEEAEGRHLLYTEIAAFCQVTQGDLRDLKARGLTAAQVKRHGYFSFPAKSKRGGLSAHLEMLVASASTVARRWNKAHPQFTLESALTRLPGHYLTSKRGKQGGYYHQIGGPDGMPGQDFGALAIPVRNAAGHTIGLRLRVKAEDSATGKKQVKWLSGKDTPSGSPIHVARPASVTDQRVWVTEGEIKANIAADVLGAVVLSIPGITNWKGLPETLDALKATGAEAVEIVVALDQDGEEATRARVAAQASAIARALTPLGYTVTIANWAPSDGKGLDDLLVAGGSPVCVPFAAPRQRGLVAVAPVTYGADSQTVTMAEAQLRLEQIAKEIMPMSWPRGAKAMELFVLGATPGVGKTHHTLSRVDALDRSGLWPQVFVPAKNGGAGRMRDVRVLILFDDLSIAAEQTKRYLGAAWDICQYDEHGEMKSRLVWNQAATNRPTLHITEGRNPAPQSGGYCANPLAGEVSGRRGLPIVDACRIGNKEDPCPFADGCAYLESKRTAKIARIVCACKSAYLTDSMELDDFDLVIMDEDTTASFLEEVSITGGDTDQWRKLLVERDVSHQFTDLERFLGWVQEASNHAKAHGEGLSFPAMPHFRATAPADAFAVLTAANEAAKWNDGGKGREFFRAICEMIWVHDRAVPLRALHDITKGLIAEWHRHPEADTRLHFSDAGTLNYRQPRLGLLHRLFARRVAILDATGDIDMIRRIHQTATANLAAPVPFTVYHVQVRHTVQLTQISDSLYGRKSLGKDGGVRWAAIEETVAAMAARLKIDPKEVARLTYKLFDPNDATSETTGDDAFMTGHYGLDNKATNRFQKCRMLVTVGNFVPNIGEIRATVEAWRFSEEPRKMGKHPVTVCYPGKAEGVERPVADDPDVQHAIAHATWVAETQALGRMRDVQRPDEVIHWVRFNRDPYIPPSPDYQAVKVTTLTTHNHLREQLGLPTVAVYKVRQQAPLRAENEKRRAAAEAKCTTAAADLAAEGKAVTANALASRAGVNYNRAKAWVEATSAANDTTPTTDSIYNTKPIRHRGAINPNQSQAPRGPAPDLMPTPPTPFTTFMPWFTWLKGQGVDEDRAIAWIVPRLPAPTFAQEAS